MKKKSLLYALLLTLLGVICFQVYHIVDNGGNVVFLVENEEYLKDKEVDVRILIDEHVFIDTLLKGDLPTIDLSKSSSLIGTKTISISSNTLNIVKHKKIFFGPMQWLRVELYKDKCILNNSYYPVVVQ